MPRNPARTLPNPVPKMSGEQIGRLFVKDYIAQTVKAITDPEEYRRRVTPGLRIPDPGPLTAPERQQLIAQLSTGVDVQAYNNYVEILSYLQLVGRIYHAHQGFAETAYLKTVMGLSRVLEVMQERYLSQATPRIMTQAELIAQGAPDGPYAMLAGAPEELMDERGYYRAPRVTSAGFQVLEVDAQTGPVLMNQIATLREEVRAQYAIRGAFEVLGERIRIPSVTAILAPVCVHFIDIYNDFLEGLHEAARDPGMPEDLSSLILSAQSIDTQSIQPTEAGLQKGRDAIRDLSFFIYRNDLHRIVQG